MNSVAERPQHSETAPTHGEESARALLAIAWGFDELRRLRATCDLNAALDTFQRLEQLQGEVVQLKFKYWDDVYRRAKDARS